MKKELQPVQHLLRQVHLLNAVEYLRYLYSVLRFHKSNLAFIQQHPGFRVPPQHLAFDAYAAPNWDYYYRSGSQLAEDIVSLIKRYGHQVGDIDILEWGCGPGRIIRHLPDTLGGQSRVYGSDYNAESIDWATASIGRVRFCRNELSPPLPFEDARFDFVYAISVFTHLSEESCLKWIDEIERVLNRDGLVFFTTNGDKVSEVLLPHERMEYDATGLCLRGKMQEGKKMFMACHSPDYVKSTLLKDFEILEHIEPGRFRYIEVQDAWVVRKKNPMTQ